MKLITASIGDPPVHGFDSNFELRASEPNMLSRERFLDVILDLVSERSEVSDALFGKSGRKSAREGGCSSPSLPESEELRNRASDPKCDRLANGGVRGGVMDEHESSDPRRQCERGWLLFDRRCSCASTTASSIMAGIGETPGTAADIVKGCRVGYTV